MVFWAEELIELVKKVSNKMEICMENAPKDENGNRIAGTVEIMQFNQYAFALFGCIDRLRKLLEEGKK